MAMVVCTHRLRDVGPVEPTFIAGETVMAVLQNTARDFPRLRSYVLDDQYRLRKHVAIFLDGAMLSRHSALTTVLSERSELYLMQALSGG